MAITPEDDNTRFEPASPAAEAEARADRPVSRGRYRLGATLGQGGMAIVVEAEDTNLKRPVANGWQPSRTGIAIELLSGTEA